MPFRLPSNAGYNSLEGDVLRAMTLWDQPALLLTLRARGTVFRRDDPSRHDLVEDFDLKLPHAVVSRAAFDALIAALRRWLETGEEFSVDLDAAQNRITLTIEVAMREDMFCGAGKPAFTLFYSSERTRVEFTWVVDPSCLLEWVEGLERSVSSP
jgi:hypothetical protein